MVEPVRIAVVTPYHREEAAVLERCIDSVRAQAAPADHILVADGFPQSWVERHGHVHHVVLSRNSGDFGDTPRSLGFMFGVRSEYDILQFLDADNVLTPDHFGSVLECLARTRADLVVARRLLLRPDGSVLNARMDEDDRLAHVDTSCFAFWRTAFHVGLKWGFIPKALGHGDDRVFYAAVKSANLNIAFLATPTVGYTCLWAHVYRAVGEDPPPGCRDLKSYADHARRWWKDLDEERRQLIQKNLGITINPE